MKIEVSKAYVKGLRKCAKRGWSIDKLDSILTNYINNHGFSADEIIKYHDHKLQGVWSSFREFHPYGRHHDWVVIYHLDDNRIVLDDTGSEEILHLDATGSHDDVFGDTQY